MSTHDFNAIPGAFRFEHGFHRVDWQIVYSWMEAHVPPAEQEQSWNAVVRTWVNHLRDDLGGGYVVAESDQAILLSDQAKDTSEWLLKYTGRAASMIRQQLGPVAWEGTGGKHLILAFSEDDDYYEYVLYYMPEGEQPSSGGMCIQTGFIHIAIPWRDQLDAANAVIHELSHACVTHLPLPLWLNEAVAVTLQRALAPTPRALGQGDQSALFAATINWQQPILWDDLAERHFAYWNGETIQAFWAGTSFHQPGDANELSYSLAEVLLRLIGEQTTTGAFRDFLRAAQQADAGQAAAWDILQVQLGEVAGKFLGPGDWQPRSERLAELWEQAGWSTPDANQDGTPGFTPGGAGSTLRPS